MKKRKQMLAAACLAVLMSQSSAFAEPSSSEEPTRNVVVTATRTEQEVADTPMAVQVITAEQIAQKGATTLRQILSNAIGIQMDKDGMNRSNIGIRGMESRHTLILVDGKRLSGESGIGSANSFDVDRISLDNVERIEIVRGPASSLYGSDAMGGVINIITKTPKKQQFDLMVEDGVFAAGSNAWKKWSARYDSGKTGKLAWSVTAGSQEDNPYVLANKTTANYYGTRWPLAFKAVWESAAGQKWTFDLDYLKEDVSKLELSGTSLRRTINHNDRTGYSLGFDSKTKGGDFKARIYQTVYNKDYESRVDATNALNNFDVVRREITVGEMQWTREWLKNHLITFGGEVRNEMIRGTRVNTGNGNYTLYREGKSSDGSEGAIHYSAGFIQDEWQLSKKLLVIPSLRLDASDKFDSALSPKLGLTYKMDASNRLKAVFGQGYKTPTPTELYHSWEMIGYRGPTLPGYWWEGNPNLKPERSTSVEFGWEWEKDARFGKVSLFHNKVKDLIDSYDTGRTRSTGGSTYDKIYSYRNVSSATLQGVEAEYRQKLNSRWDAGVNYTYLHAVDDSTGNRLTRRPSNKFGVDLAYRGDKSDFTATLSGMWLSGYIDDTMSPVQEKAYGIWNLMLTQKLGGNTTVYAGVDNIFDYKDEALWINGAVYRLGMKLHF